MKRWTGCTATLHSLLRKRGMSRNVGTTTAAREQPGGREHWNAFSAQKGACQCRFAISDSLRNTLLRKMIESRRARKK